MKAWKTELIGITCIVAASSRAKAKYITYRSADEADYKVRLLDVTAKRATEFDPWASETHEGDITTPEMASKEMLRG